jgi:hypothetical protein
MAVKDKDDPLNIFNVLKQIDNKNYDFYDSLDENQKKTIAPYVIMKWDASVYGSYDLQGYHVVANNTYVNEDFFSLYNHKKLQYLLCCVPSPGLGNQKHYWLGSQKGKRKSPLKNYLLEKFSLCKESDIDVMLATTSREEMEVWLKSNGLEEKQIKEFLK